MLKHAVLLLAFQMALSTPLLASGLSYKEQVRQQAEHDCYDDVQRLCPNDIPDEDRIKACMKVNRKQLSPACTKVNRAGFPGGS